MKINSTKDKVLYKLYQLINNYRAKKIISNYNEKHYLNIVKLLDDFQNVSHFKKSPELKWRIVDLLNLIKKYNIRSIAEIGTGRTTILFEYLRKNKFLDEILSVEQDEEFAKFLKTFLNKVKLSNNIVHSSYIKTERGGYLKHKIKYVDLLYVDGPIDLSKKKYNTITGKPEYSDSIKYLEEGVRPKIIMFDGRIDSVNLIYNSNFIKDYKFKGSFSWGYNNKKLELTLYFNRHSSYFKT